MENKISKTYPHQRVKKNSMNTTDEIIGIHKEIKSLNSKIDRILRTLIGDEEMAQEGLVTKVDRHEKWIENQSLFIAKIMGVAVGSGLFGGFIGQFIINYLLK